MKAIDQQQAPAVAAINGRFQNIPLKVDGRAAQGRRRRSSPGRSRSPTRCCISFRPGAGEDRIPRVGSLEIQGPFNPTGLSDTPSRQRVFVCRPTSQRRGAAVRDDDPLDARAPRVPPSGHRCRISRRRWPSTARARATGDFDTAIRDALPDDSGQPEVPVSRRAARRPASRRARSTASAISTWRRGCRSS